MWFVFLRSQVWQQHHGGAVRDIVAGGGPGLSGTSGFLSAPADLQRTRQSLSMAIDRRLGSPDDMKFRSSMTLFAQATADNRVFPEALQRFRRRAGSADAERQQACRYGFRIVALSSAKARSLNQSTGRRFCHGEAVRSISTDIGMLGTSQPAGSVLLGSR